MGDDPSWATTAKSNAKRYRRALPLRSAVEGGQEAQGAKARRLGQAAPLRDGEAAPLLVAHADIGPAEGWLPRRRGDAREP